MRRLLPLLAISVFAVACESPAATETIELTIREIGPADQSGDQISAEIALVGGQCDVGPCLPNPCPDTSEDEMDLPGQTRCVGMGMQFQCFCPAGQHLETNMETMLEECVPDTQCEQATCNGHGACTEMDGNLMCECDEGYLGANCEQCDEENGFSNDGFGGCAQDVPVCRIGGAAEFASFLADAESELGRPPVELAVTSIKVDIIESSALVVRAWPAIFTDEARAYFRTYDGFPDEAARFEIWSEDENDEFIQGSDTMPTIDGNVLIGRQTLKSDPAYLRGEFAVGIEGTTPLQSTQPYGFDAKITLEVEAY